MEKLTLKQYLIIFALFILVNILSILVTKELFTQPNDSNEVVLFNLKVLNAKVSKIKDIVKLSASEVKLKDRLDPNLVSEFGEDDAFLQKIVVLKKQIIRWRLEGEVVKLENEKNARNSILADSYDSPYKNNTASKIFDVILINSGSGIAIVRVDGNTVTIKEGDNIKGFIVRKINPASVVMGVKDGDDETLGLNYLSNKLQQEENDENVKQ